MARDEVDRVDTLIHSRTFEVEQVCEHDSSVVLREPASLLPDIPLVSGGVSHKVIMADHDQIWLESLQGIGVGSVLRQGELFTSDEAILQQFAKVWQPRWNKASHVLDSQWHQINSFIEAHFTPIEWSFQTWTGPEVRRLAKQKKPKSAVGPDGVSRVDILSLPSRSLTSLAAMFQEIEEKSAWPAQLLQGIVSGLSKGRGEGVDAYRPITIYPFLTRVWSTFRARDAMKSLLSHLPSSVRGAVPNKQAKQVWFEISQMIEASFVADSPIQGILLDVQRAFNALPRDPIWTLLIALDAPKWFVKTWSAFVAGQNRRFRVRTSVGEPIYSAVGYPEGCALSVVAMTLLDWVLDQWLSAMVGDPHSLVTYVDDWHILYPQVVSFPSLWSSVQAFASATDLVIDEKKSHLWASHPGPRAALRNSGNQVTLAARDLGAHHNFCLRRGNCTLVSRLEQMPSVWVKLRACVSPYRLKIFGLLQLAWTRAFYGISVVHLGASHFTKLRTGASRGLRVDRIGSNPLLHLSSNGFQVDPEAFCIAQTLREVREVGNIDWMQNVWQLLWIDPSVVPFNGPCRILVSRLARLGWTLLPAGQCSDLLGVFCPFTLPWNDVAFRMQLAWPQVMAAEVAHRTSFQGLEFANLFELKLALKRFGAADIAYLRCSLDGTLYHDVGKDKSNRGQHSTCQFCGARDSVYHHVWCCPHTQPCRSQFPWMNLIESLPPCLTCHGWPVLTRAWISLQQWFVAVPVPHFAVVPSGSTCGVVDLFTDGACACPTSPGLRFSSWAVTQAVGPSGSLAHIDVDSGWVWGIHQTAYRGELIAMWRALVHCSQGSYRARIWCDNQTVVKRVGRLLSGGRVKPNVAHADILNNIVQVVEQFSLGDRVQVAKVTSHCLVQRANTDVEAWVFWHNQQVDELATTCNFNRPASFWQLWNEAVAATKFQRELHFEILKVHLSVAKRKPEGTNGDAVSVNKVQPPVEFAAEYHRPRVQPSLQLEPLLHTLGRKYRPRNVQAVHDWWTTTGAECLKTKQQLHWVSGLQLFLDFFATTHFGGLISPHHKIWYDDQSLVPDTVRVDVISRTTAFLRVWVAYTKGLMLQIPHKLQRPFSACISFWTMCYRLPWSPDRLEQLDRWMFQRLGRQAGAPRDLVSAGLLDGTFSF